MALAVLVSFIPISFWRLARRRDATKLDAPQEDERRDGICRGEGHSREAPEMPQPCDHREDSNNKLVVVGDCPQAWLRDHPAG